jgi:hypothetical protein
VNVEYADKFGANKENGIIHIPLSERKKSEPKPAKEFNT